MTEDEAEKLLQTLDDFLTPPDSWHSWFGGRPHPAAAEAEAAILRLRQAIGNREILFQDRRPGSRPSDRPESACSFDRRCTRSPADTSNRDTRLGAARTTSTLR